MADTDWIALLLPTIVTVIVGFVMLALTRFARTSDSTLKTGVKIEGLRADLNEHEKKTAKDLEKLEHVAQNRHEESAKFILDISLKLQEAQITIRHLESRMAKVEQDHVNFREGLSRFSKSWTEDKDERKPN